MTGTPACCALAAMRVANGWVASTIVVMPCSRTYRARPSAPPNAVVRAGARMASSPNACLSSLASCVPPRISTRMNGDADRHVQVIGIGAGDPAWLTLEAARALEALDVAFVFVKGSGDELAAARRGFLPAHVREVLIEDPPRGRGAGAVAAGRAERVRLVREAAAREPGSAGFLAWGDPTL